MSDVPRDSLEDVERAGFLLRVRYIRPREGSIEAFEDHTRVAGHFVSWDEARGVFRDQKALLLRSGQRHVIFGQSWGDERILVVVLDLDDKGVGTLITARPATPSEKRKYRQRR